jgi:hypothetical protein
LLHHEDGDRRNPDGLAGEPIRHAGPGLEGRAVTHLRLVRQPSYKDDSKKELKRKIRILKAAAKVLKKELKSR